MIGAARGVVRVHALAQGGEFTEGLHAVHGAEVCGDGGGGGKGPKARHGEAFQQGAVVKFPGDEGMNALLVKPLLQATPKGGLADMALDGRKGIAQLKKKLTICCK